MIDEIEQLIKRVDDVIKKPKWHRAPRSLLYFDFLSFRGNNCLGQNVEHYYDVVPRSPDLSKLNIIHGHDKYSRCVASSYCHEYGFKPTRDMFPSFITQFSKKWSHLYETI